MNKEELIEVLRQFDEKRVEELPEKTRNIFYAIMKIADERDELENIRKEAIEYINHEIFKRTILVGVGTKKYTRNILDNILNILNKGENNE